MSNAERLRTLLAYPASPEHERELHERFSAHRRSGEWFAPAPELLAYIAERTLMKKTGRKRTLPKIISHEEVQRLLAQPNLRTPTGLRDRCLLELMYRAGLRLGETRALRPRDVDHKTGVVRVPIEGKTGERTAYFDAASVGTLIDSWKRERRHHAGPDSPLFCTLKGGPLGSRHVQLMIRRRAAKAGIQARVTPHVLRHTFATELLEEGFTIREVQEALGHSDVSVTMIYTWVLDTNLRAKIQRRKR